MQLGSPVATAMAQASATLQLTPSLGTSLCRRCGHKKKKEKYNETGYAYSPLLPLAFYSSAGPIYYSLSLSHVCAQDFPSDSYAFSLLLTLLGQSSVVFKLGSHILTYPDRLQFCSLPFFSMFLSQLVSVHAGLHGTVLLGTFHPGMIVIASPFTLSSTAV